MKGDAPPAKLLSMVKHKGHNVRGVLTHEYHPEAMRAIDYDDTFAKHEEQLGNTDTHDANDLQALHASAVHKLGGAMTFEAHEETSVNDSKHEGLLVTDAAEKAEATKRKRRHAELKAGMLSEDSEEEVPDFLGGVIKRVCPEKPGKKGQDASGEVESEKEDEKPEKRGRGRPKGKAKAAAKKCHSQVAPAKAVKRATSVDLISPAKSAKVAAPKRLTDEDITSHLQSVVEDCVDIEQTLALFKQERGSKHLAVKVVTDAVTKLGKKLENLEAFSDTYTVERPTGWMTGDAEATIAGAALFDKAHDLKSRGDIVKTLLIAMNPPKKSLNAGTAAVYAEAIHKAKELDMELGCDIMMAAIMKSSQEARDIKDWALFKEVLQGCQPMGCAWMGACVNVPVWLIPDDGQRASVQTDVLVYHASEIMKLAKPDPKESEEMIAEKYAQAAIDLGAMVPESILDTATARTFEAMQVMFTNELCTLTVDELRGHLEYFKNPLCKLRNQAKVSHVLVEAIARKAALVVQMEGDRRLQSKLTATHALVQREGGLLRISKDKPVEYEKKNRVASQVSQWTPIFSTISQLRASCTPAFLAANHTELEEIDVELASIRHALLLRPAWIFADQIAKATDALMDAETDLNAVKQVLLVEAGLQWRAEDFGLNSISTTKEIEEYNDVMILRTKVLTSIAKLLTKLSVESDCVDLAAKEVHTAMQDVGAAAANHSKVWSPESTMVKEACQAFARSLAKRLMTEVTIALKKRIQKEQLSGLVGQMAAGKAPGSATWTPQVFPAIADGSLDPLSDVAHLIATTYHDFFTWAQDGMSRHWASTPELVAEKEDSLQSNLQITLAELGGTKSGRIELKWLCSCFMFGKLLMLVKAGENFNYENATTASLQSVAPTHKAAREKLEELKKELVILRADGQKVEKSCFQGRAITNAKWVWSFGIGVGRKVSDV